MKRALVSLAVALAVLAGLKPRPTSAQAAAVGAH